MALTFEAQAPLPTALGNFNFYVFADDRKIEYIALTAGNPANGCLARIHSECATGDLFSSLRCDCGPQLNAALQKIDEAKQGVVIYMRGHEGRGIGLANKIKAYALQDKGMDTVAANLCLGFPADQRDYSVAVEILKYFGLSEVRLMTNNPEKLSALEDGGIKILERVPLWLAENPHNERYLATKVSILGHLK